MADTDVEANDAVDEPTDQRASFSKIEVRPGETELAAWVDRLFGDAERARTEQANTDSWDDWLEAYWGDMWDGDLPTYKPPIVVNELQSLLLQEVSDLSDNPPRIFVQKEGGDVQARDKQREKAIQAFWKNGFVDAQLMLATLDASIFPLGFVGVTFDPTADFGRGKLIVRSRSPYSVFPDPDAVDDDDWRYLILRDVMDVVAIHETWPEHGPRVRPDMKYSLKLSEADASSRRTGLSGSYSGPLYSGNTSSNFATDGFLKARAGVLSCFVIDNSAETEIVERLNDMAEKTLVTVRKKKYPYGRLIQVANGVVLYDGPNPYIRRFPVVRVSLQPTVHSFWPPSSVLAGVLELYRSANKIDSMTVENGLRLNAGMIVADTNSGIDPANFAAIPGQILLKNPGAQVDVKYPPPMPPDMIQGGERLRSYARKVLGFTDSRIGAGQRGNVSPELTETEISQAMGLTRLRGRLLHNATQKLVDIIFAGMARFYTDSRIFPNSNGDRWQPATWTPIESPEQYIVHVDPASFQVRSKTMMQRLYMTLAMRNKIPDDELLQALDIPNAEEVAAKQHKQLQLAALAGLQDEAKRKSHH